MLSSYDPSKEESISTMHFLSWFVMSSELLPQAFQEGPLYFFHSKLACLKSCVPLVSHHSYKRCHHCRRVTQSLDSGIRTLLKIMVVPWHVEGWESGATALHGAGYSRGCKRHSQAAVWRQRSLDRMRNGCSYGCGAGTQGTQRLWMLKSWETGWRGNPGTEGQVIRCCKGWPCKQRERIPNVGIVMHKAGKAAKREKMSLSQQAWFQWPVVIRNTSQIFPSLKCYLLVAILYHYIFDKFPFSEAGCSGFSSKIRFAHWTF